MTLRQLPLRQLFGAAALLAWSAPAVLASDLDVSVESSGQNLVVVAPGSPVPYQVVGELTDGANEGLAMFRLDLAFDGGPLAQAATPTTSPMDEFAAPNGFNNPDGFGGTIVAGALVQVGGMMNTIKNTLPSASLKGGVVTGVAANGMPQVLASGSLVAPTRAGTYQLAASEVGANVIRQGETGVPFWRVEEAGVGTVTNLTVVVEALSGTPGSVSIGSGGSQVLSLDAGVANQSRFYLLLGSLSGSQPGIDLGQGVVLPLNFDAYLAWTLNGPNQPPLTSSFGVLDASGQATTTFTLPAGSNPNLIGLTATHAFGLLLPIDFVSNPVSVQLVN